MGARESLLQRALRIAILPPDELTRVNEPGKTRRKSMPAGQRFAMVVSALTLLALPATAAILTPDEHGFGTHQQLGLPPCTFYVVFQRPCPACGMTTAWAWLLRGEIGHALAANAGGTLLAGLDLVAAAWLLVSALRGQWFPGRPSQWMIAAVAGLVGMVTAGQWVWRLLTF